MTAPGTIAETEFQKRIKAHRITGSRTIQALYFVMVAGKGKAEAARLADVDASVVTRGLARMKRPTCLMCGHELSP